jgi:hypothetical protein
MKKGIKDMTWWWGQKLDRVRDRTAVIVEGKQTWIMLVGQKKTVFVARMFDNYQNVKMMRKPKADGER